MARLARVVLPEVAHHVTQRGNRLMPNHVHLIAVPRDTEGLAKAMGEAHRRYTSNVNFSKGWTFERR